MQLDTLLTQPFAYALGPVAGLQGEITIYNVLVSISTVKEEQPEISTSRATGAIFLIKAYQKNWKAIPITKTLEGQDAVENFVKAVLERNGLDSAKPYPFRIEATIPFLAYHIIFKRDNQPHSMKEHQKAKQKFTLHNEALQIIGFWVDEDRIGQLTHPGKRIHMHFINTDNSTSGHVDDIVVHKGAQLFIPK